MSPKFPTVIWGATKADFLPAVEGETFDRPVSAALVFAFHEARVVLANIGGRGWCIPSGRLEPGESPEAAARREAWEEAGLILEALAPIGWTILDSNDGPQPVIAINYVSTVLRFDPIPEGFESRGIRLATREELPTCYFQWDELMTAIFDFAWERIGYSSQRIASSAPTNQ